MAIKNKNAQGQVALEFVLIAGAIMLMGILVYPFATDQITLNKANTAARDGATAAIGVFNMGYTISLPPLGYVGGPKKAMRLTEANIIHTSTANNTRNYEIQLVIDYPENETVNQDYVGQVIGAHVMSYVDYAFSADWLTLNSSAYNATVLVNRMEFSFGSITWE